MLFNSCIFILCFLPICIIGYFTLNHIKQTKLAQIFLLAMSLWFYGFFNLYYMLIIIFSIVVNYSVYKLFFKGSYRKGLLVVALLFNLGMLFYFKYYDFFIQNVNFIFGSNIALKKVILPLGISFFTFQQISFIIDAYKGEVPDYGFINYASFVTFFPQLIAGPIVVHNELVPQFLNSAKKRFQWENFARGIYIFTLGLGKKVILADTFGNAVNWGFSNIAELDSTNAIIVMLSYTFQIYFDFSGYCDMAIGIGQMLNIDLPLNFNSPYKALTITDFWKRWHITLTRFFTKYLYIPLGGNRKGRFRLYVNILIIYFVSGLWHGANWTFILWGLLHGLFMIIVRHKKDFFERLHPALNWIITFVFVNLTWIFFRADTIKDALRIIYRISCLNFSGINSNIAECFNLPEFQWIFNVLLDYDILSTWPFFFLSVFMCIAFMITLGSENTYEKMKKFKPTPGKLLVLPFLLVWCIFSFSGISTFLYFNF